MQSSNEKKKKVDRSRDQLMLLQSDMTVDLRFPLQKGIAGHVASSGKGLNIKDAYSDPRFVQVFFFFFFFIFCFFCGGALIKGGGGGRGFAF